MIYVDEAGTSAKEPVSIVVGVVLHGDSWRVAETALRGTLDQHVPAQLRPGFFFHAKEVRLGYRAHEQWTKEQRELLVAAVAAIPRNLGFCVAVGKVRRDWRFEVPGIRQEEFHHLVAFRLCLGRANKYVRDFGEPSQVATVVAEDDQSRRRILKHALDLPDVNLPLTSELVRLTAEERSTGKITQTRAGTIDRIVDGVHFVEKKDAPLLQIADACAFVFRRYLAAMDGGEQLISHMLGRSLVWDDWQGPMSDFAFRFGRPSRRPS